ncbi:hypothetical protein [Pseudomonas sp. PMCC200344]|uniref:hypothetical protein n=1 Tax=Pseudomonas sp. PMCC200344 TaxID=3042028 RepID=UPI0024B3C18D|nr:hypothetical protein [Pseudomonas sp. PMCC200344]
MPNLKGPDITKELFGGIFDSDGAGHFPGLELINFIVCGSGEILPGPEVKEIKLIRRSHDFARRLVAGRLPPDLKSKVLLNEHSENAVAHLLHCLELEAPNITKTKSWERTHFFPYTRSLVHWDARSRSSAKGEKGTIKVNQERRYLRGGGAFAFSVLRHDPDQDRLNSIRDGFRSLYPSETNTPLETLSAALLKHGEIDKDAVIDLVEPQTRIRNDKLENLYRDGIKNVLSHDNLSSVQRVKAVMNWTGFWLVILEATRAAEHLNKSWQGLIVDCAGVHPQLRRASQKCLKVQLSNIEDAANLEAKIQTGEISKQQINRIKGFFSNTAGTCGLLNAAKGRRHFTLKLHIVEALVLASAETQTEQTFEDFVSKWLGERCGLVLGRNSASGHGMLNAFDATIFEENERQFAEQMKATGMLRVYSDATRMVSAEITQ